MWLVGINHERGFTLLELLVVIVLIGLLASVGAQTIFHLGNTLNREADRIEQRLYQASIQARESGLKVSVACARLLSGPVGASSHDAPSVSCRSESGPMDFLTFYPDGSSSGGSIKLRTDIEHIILSVGWLSGEVIRE